MFLVDKNIQLLDYNTAAAKLLQAERSEVLKKRGGDVLHCLNAIKSPAGCGQTRACRDCVIREAVDAAMTGESVRRQQAFMELQTPEGLMQMDILITTSPVDLEGERRVLLILENIAELLTSREIIPICSNCKAIRDDRQCWEKLESYLHHQLHLDFSHGLCPNCTQKLFPNCVTDMENRGTKSSNPSASTTLTVAAISENKEPVCPPQKNGPSQS